MATMRSQTYHLTLHTLTPLHIGTGQDLLRGYDFDVRNGRTWVINQEALAEEIYGQGEDTAGWRALAAGRPGSEFLRPEDFRSDSPLFRYSLAGEPDAKAAGSKVREQIKTPWDEAYIPGSSLKGALRTAFLYVAFGQLGMTFDPAKLNDRPKIAAQPLENDIVAVGAARGKTPNYDLFRALQVSDSSADADRRLRLCNVKVFTGKEAKAPIAVEAIAKDTTFEARMTLDMRLLNDYGPQELGWDADKQVRWLKRLRDCANALSRERVIAEHAFWNDRAPALRNFYLSLADQLAGVPKNTFYLQLGWAGGWTSKTFGQHLTANPAAFYATVSAFRRDMDRQNTYKPGDAFPKSRRILVNQHDQPVRPLGWIQVTMERER